MPRITRHFKEEKKESQECNSCRFGTSHWGWGGPFFFDNSQDQEVKVKVGAESSNAEVGAAFLVRAPPLLPLFWGVLGSAAGGLGLQPHLLPFPLADFVFSIPFFQGSLSPPFWGAHSPPVGGFCAPFWGVPSPLIQKSFQRPAAAAGGTVMVSFSPAGGRSLSPPFWRRSLLSFVMLLPPFQSGVCAPGTFPTLLRRFPPGPVIHHPLCCCCISSSPLGHPVLGSACPTVGFPRCPVPGMMLIGLPAIFSAAFGIFPVCPLFPMG